MMFNKPIWAPNLIIVDSPVSGIEGLEIALSVLKKLNMNNQVIGICTVNDKQLVNNDKRVIQQSDYAIYREVSKTEKTLASKLLAQKAKIVYYIVSEEQAYKAAIINVYDLINTEYPILCVSRHLSFDVRPAALIVPTQADKALYAEKAPPAFKNKKLYTLSEFSKCKVLFKDQSYRIE